MEKTILIGTGNGYSSKANIRLFIVTGLLFLVNGTFLVYNNVADPMGLIIGVFTLFGSIYYLLFGYLSFSKKSKWAPRIIVTTDHIEIKQRMFKPAIKVAWENVRSIVYGSYKITLELAENKVEFNYEANPETSIEIKETIREAAGKKEIEVVGG